MASPIALNDIVPGVILTGMTPSGKEQVRLVLDVNVEGKYNGTYRDQLVEDGCYYMVVAGPREGEVGQCLRISLMGWARSLRKLRSICT
jgi:hypothetical protein